MNESEDRLIECKLQLKGIDDALDAVKAEKAKALAEVAEIEKKIEEAKRRMMRSGDMFYSCNNGKPVLITKSAPNAEGVFENGSMAFFDRDYYIKTVVMLNGFDDLKAMQEDVPSNEIFEFVTDTCGGCVNLKVQIKSDSVWLWSSNGRGVQLKDEKLADLILYLRRLQHTLRSKK
jgi:hypothetical protein